MEGYKEIPLTRQMVENGELKPGDKVVSSVTLQDNSEKYKIEAGKLYTVDSIPPRDPRGPGAFLIMHPSGQTWGFFFEKKGGYGEAFSKVVVQPGYEIFFDYEDLPYKFMKYIYEHPNQAIEDTFKGVIADELRVPPRQRKTIVKQLTDILDNLIFLDFVEEVENLIKLTDKGEQFLNAK